MASVSDRLAIVALVISLVALVGTVLQVLQQYLASAYGYSNLDKTVIGDWINTKRRKFSFGEMRFRVVYETPVFFVCSALNDRGPIENTPILFVEGTDQSIRATRSLDPSTRMPEGAVHTTNGEMATWVKMLMEFHRMEMNSRRWQQGQKLPNAQNTEPSPMSRKQTRIDMLRAKTQRAKTMVQRGLGKLGTPGPSGSTSMATSRSGSAVELLSFQQHTLCLALQAKKQSWDTMRPGIQRPYATSTISHMVEMAAMLGLYWQEFDRSAGRYRAEGNGYVLTGTHTQDLGILFTFEVCGQSRHFENRVVPRDEVKDLAFGCVPTIFRSEGEDDKRRLTFVGYDFSDDGILRLASLDELAGTLVSLGCNTSTSKYLSEKEKHAHLFSLAFELVGMLGRTLHMRDTLFRLLPNPTFAPWDKRYFNMQQLFEAYQIQMTERYENTANPQIQALLDLVVKVATTLKDKAAYDNTQHQRYTAQHPTHNELPKKHMAPSIVSATECSGKSQDRGAVVYRELLYILHDVLDDCDEYLCKTADRAVVQTVVRVHFQELLLLLNEDGQDEKNSTDRLRFVDLETAAPEEREQQLMQIYFSTLQLCVLGKVDKTDKALHGLADADQSEEPAGHGALAEAIWCMLVFRMICWLMLHDFNKNDMQKQSKSELYGSRLPVYIV